MTGPQTDRSGEVLRALGEVAEGALGRFDVDDLLRELLDRVTELLGTDTAAVLLLDERANQLVARAARGVEIEVRQGVRIPVGVGFAGRIATERRPIALERVDHTTVANPLLWQRGIRSMLGVPLLAGNRLLGVLHVGTFSGRPFTEADARLLEAVAERVAQAVERREREVEQAVGRVLQRSLLPAAVPSCPGLQFAARYVPAEHGGVGGDWYDAFVLEDGTLWLTMGDVAGHGLEASVIMGRLRSTLRAYSLEHEDPAEVLARADRKLQRFEPGELATVLAVVSRPPYDHLILASAGHLPPVLAAPRDAARLLWPPLGPPLGVDLDAPRTSTVVELPPGAILVTYTDGLVERRRASLDRGVERLRQLVHPTHPEALCYEVMGALVGDKVNADDIAVLALRRTEPVA